MYWYLGKLQRSHTLNLPLDHPALLYGASLFTTLRIYGDLDAPLTHWQAHCDRLARSIATLGWTRPDWQRIRAGATAIAEMFPVVRITIFPGGAELITGRSLPEDLTLRQQAGIHAWVATHPSVEGFTRSLPDHKTGNYLVPWLALQQARSHQTQEAILVNGEGHWLETSTGNLWGWKANRWYTPPLETHILPGVIRQHLITHLQACQQEVVETPWSPDHIQGLELLLYTNCVVEAIPITVVYTEADKLGYGTHHPAIEQLRSYFRQQGVK